MNRNFVAVACLTLVIVFGFGAQAAEKAVTVSPLGLVVGMVNGEYEQKLSRDMTLGIQGAVWSTRVNNYTVNAFGAGVGVRKYMSGKALNGFYVGGYGNMSSLTINDAVDSIGATVFMLTGQAGFKWLLANGFAIDLSANLGLPLAATASANGEKYTKVAIGSIGSGIGFGLGYAWQRRPTLGNLSRATR